MIVNCPIEWREINDFAEILIMDSSNSTTFNVFPKLVSVVEDKKEDLKVLLFLIPHVIFVLLLLIHEYICK